MKHILIYMGVALSFLASLSSCKDQIEENYTNPEKSTTGYCGKLFTYMLYNDRIRPTYWDYATFVTGVTGKYSQFLGIETANKMYEPSISYNEDRWESYYTGGIMNNYREIEKTYDALSDAQKTDNYVFLQLAKVVLYDQTSQMIDLWGDIPFSEAGSLNSTNTLGYAKFDDAEDLYSTLIGELKSLNTYFDTVSLSTAAVKSLASQDIMLGGDVSLWRKYTNSLRLRLLMRISNFNESLAKTEILTMLNDPDTYPVVDSNSENILLKMNPTSLTSEGLESGLTDGATSNGPYAPYFMVENIMNSNNDPRTRVFWNPNTNNEFKGIPTDITASEQDALITSNLVATIDSGTFIMNRNVPGTVFTASEVSFLKAEAYERWGGGSAQTAYEDGIKQSIDFYYGINQSAYFVGYSKVSETSPSTSEITDYIAGTAIAYSGTSDEKLSKIYTQKWINFFILQAGQAWAEQRRTGYPVLTFADDPSSSSDAVQPPYRILYPETEKSYNASNYATVKSKDTRDTKIFWDVE